MSGSTPTTSTTATPARSTSRRSGTWSTGTSPPNRWPEAAELAALQSAVSRQPAAAASPLLAVEQLACRFDGETVVDGVDLELAAGELACLLGPSGCGKTTLLRAIAGFHAPAAGRILLRGEEVASTTRQRPPERRGLGLVFQDLALFPHLDVAGNVGFGLNAMPRAERAARVEETLAMIGLSGFGSRFPHELSGGQQQRVALARSLAPRPDLLLLDEPFSSLDAHLRGSLRDDLISVLRRLEMTALLVTHDQEEAFAFGDRVAVMRAGRIEQWASGFEVYHRPATPFVAQFVGEGRLLPGELLPDGSIQTAIGRVRGRLPDGVPGAAGTRVRVLVRPDDLLPQDGGDSEGLEASIIGVSFRGAEMLYTLRLVDGTEVCALFPSHHRHAVGERIRVRTDLEHTVVFATTD